MTKKLIITAAIAASLVGCSGGSSTPPERPAAQLDGVAADNIIRNGQVRVYRWDGHEREILLSTKTDNYGYYADPLQSESQFIKVCITGGEYTEEASSINIKLEGDDRLCAVTYWESSQPQEVMVTPETNLATALMEYKIKAGETNLQNIVANSNSKIGTLFGYDILTTRPADMTSDDLRYTGLNDEIRSGLWHSAFSRLALAAAATNGQQTHTSLISSMQLHKALYRDLASDGKLDGWGLADNGKTKIRLGLGNYELNAHVYRTELARELVNFVQSDRNKTAVKATDVLSYANTFSMVTDSIFDENDIPVAFDTDAPTVAFDTPENTYIANTHVLGVSVTDFSGVKSVTYTINGGNEQAFDFSQDKLTINTKSYADGDLELALTVVDKLDNTAVIKRTFKVANTKPVMNIASKSLVNDTNYTFIADVGEVAAGVARVEVNARAADYDANQISASVRLQEGTNTISVKIIDLANAEYTYTFNVIADTAKPDISWKTVAWKTLIKRNATISNDVLKQTMTNEYVFITPNYYRLGSVVAGENELSAKNWPTYKVTVTDPNRNNVYSTKPEDLAVSLIYSDTTGSNIYFSRTVKSNETGDILIPLSEEFLGTKWYEKEAGKLLTINVTDEAGNKASFPIRFEVAVSAPSLSPDLDLNTNLRGTVTIDMDGRELQGADAIRILLDGKKEFFLPWDNPKFDIDTNSLEDGIHYINTYVTTGGELLFEKTFEFFIDNTAPEITFDSSQLVNSAGRIYTLKGNVNDFGGSGVASLKGRLLNNSFTMYANESFTKDNLSLQSGDNEIIVTAIDVAGNETVATHYVLHDDDEPKFQWKVVNGKHFDKIKDDLFNTNFNVHVGYTHVPIVAGMFTHGSEPYYLDNQNNNLQDLSTKDVGGNVDALNADGSLNLSNAGALYFLTNGRGRTNHGIPHFNFVVSDSQYRDVLVSGEKANTVVNATKLKTYLTVQFGNDEPVVLRKLLQPVELGSSTTTQQYFVPITKELFTDELLTLPIDKKVKVTFTVEDEAGNKTGKSYEFYVFNAPISTIPPKIEGGLNTTMTNGNLNLSVTVTTAVGLSRVHLNDKVLFDSLGKPTTTTFPVSSMANTEGKHSWTLEVVDLAGNVATQTYTGEIDKTKPEVAINGVPNIAAQEFTFNWTVSEKNPVTVTVFDGTAIKPNVTSKSGSLTITPTGTDGARTIKVTAVDAAGNTSYAEAKTNFSHNPAAFVSKKVSKIASMYDGAGYHMWTDIELTFDKAISNIKPLRVKDENNNGYWDADTQMRWGCYFEADGYGNKQLAKVPPYIVGNKAYIRVGLMNFNDSNNCKDFSNEVVVEVSSEINGKASVYYIKKEDILGAF